MSSQETAIERLKDLLTQYQRGKGNFLEQTSKTGSSWADYKGGSFPEKISRGQLLEDASKQNVDLLDLFVRIMAWGFGPAGYAHYRTNRILAELNTVGGRTIDGWMKELRSAASESPTKGYEFLGSEFGKVKYLGPAFATKLLYFLSPQKNHAPILDSVVADWLWRYEIATDGQSINLEFADLDGYKRYVDFVDRVLTELSELLAQNSDEIDRGFVEYLIFQDQLAYRSELSLEMWMRRVEFKLA